MENIKSNEDITDITEVLEITQPDSWLDKQDVGGYKWKLVSDNQNEPTQVHFYKEDMTDTLSINLSTILDRHLREYKRHLFLEEDREKVRVEREKRVKIDKLFDEKIDEVIESYELFLKQQVKDVIHDRLTNVDCDEYGSWGFNLHDIRVILDKFSIDGDYDYQKYGIHSVGGGKRMVFRKLRQTNSNTFFF